MNLFRHLAPRTAFWALFFIGLAPGLLYIFESAQHQRLRQEELHSTMLAQSAIQLNEKIKANTAMLEALAGYLEVTGKVDLNSFSRFSKKLFDTREGLDAASLAFRVQPEDRRRFEREYLGGRVIHPVPAGNTGHETSYVVVGKIEPLASNAAALGLDLNSESQRREAIERAESTDRTAWTVPLHLVQDPPGELSMLAVHQTLGLSLPGYAKSRVYVTALLRISSMVAFVNSTHADCKILRITDTSSTPPSIVWDSDAEKTQGNMATTRFLLGEHWYDATGTCEAQMGAISQSTLPFAVGIALIVALLTGLLGRSIAQQRQMEEEHRRELQEYLISEES